MSKQKPIEIIEAVFQGAEAHGAESEAGHQVGDLEAALRAAWKLMTKRQRLKLMDAPEVAAIVEWLD